ncbi:group 1 glycosyl transferase [Acetobacter aceti NRIC 0242]|uniref:Glycosyl transferase n=1 Tax=Acetobacter aceti NBRC 14818 TaxID=887700 RepID=A0AB33IH89_ACEAC|nr:glycosyltransferase [Acetobacter aceti]TCS31986.1 glycosyltransferase involved in cell wall biosynthesis [Acetobacter aceti NBRC 14818]BCK77287.1 glycosyl transferase [Acetobacter aceti NBRC 14818]GAN58388.1 glycosyl transferase group 1 [Acetobacter aceti NBRC 14818]GBO81646.1 group 1 glycosyl transferase [Acetobacter aceti NRIC 0242]
MTRNSPFPEKSSRAHVLFINDTSRNGGPGQTLLNILKYLDPDRIRRSVMLPREDLVSHRIREWNAAETQIIEPAILENLVQPLSRAMTRQDFEAPLPLLCVRAASNIGRAFLGMVRLVAHVRKQRYDVIFCNGTTAGFIGGLLAALPGMPPVVWHVFYPAVPRPLRPIHRWLAARVKTILCVSQAVSPQFSSCAGKVEILHDAIDLEVFDRAIAANNVGTGSLREELGISDNIILFGAHGRIVPHKGFYELIEVARSLFVTLGADAASQCRFVVIGDTPQDSPVDHLALCREKVRSLGLEGFMHFVGFRSDVRPCLADIDVAVVPSIYPDPLPLSVLESMAMKKPVIAFDMGGIGEMVRNVREGVLLRGTPPDTDGMARACHDALTNREKWRGRGLAARLRVERHFDARPHAAAIQSILLHLAGKEIL